MHLTAWFKRFQIAYPTKDTRSPILAPSGGSKGSTMVEPSFEAHKTWKEKPIAQTALQTNWPSQYRQKTMEHL